MNISAELVAIAILGVSLVSLGWKVSSDIRRELKQEIHYVREDVAGLGDRIGNLEFSSCPDWKAGWRVAVTEELELKAKPSK